MRLSRKAGLLAGSIRWVKYRCAQGIERQTWYELWPAANHGIIESGTDVEGQWQGYTGYSVELNDAGYAYVYVSNGIVGGVDATNPGTVYEIGATGVTPYLDTITVDSSGNYTVHRKYLYTQYYYKYTIDYSKEWYVRAADGEWPDADIGYTYEGTYNGYTIMYARGAEYYAYAKV